MLILPTPTGSYEFEQGYKLGHHGRTTVMMAAEALLAMERITLRSPLAINKMAGPGAIMDVSVYLKKLEEGSLLHDYYVRIFFGTPEKELEFYDWLRKRTGMDQSKVKTLFAIIGTAMVAGGVSWAVSKYVTGSAAQDKAATVLAWNNTIVQIGASELKMTPAEFVAIIEKAQGSKATNARTAAKLLHPAKSGDTGAIMEIIGHSELNVPADVVAAMPTPDQIDDPLGDHEVAHSAVEVFLRASDLDSSSRGWAALIPEIADRRLRLELGPSISADLLYGKKKVIADVIAVMRVKPGTEAKPIKYRITKIHGD